MRGASLTDTIGYEKATIEQARERIAYLESIGEDDYEDGSILVFDHTYAGSDQAYTFSAIRAGARWYLTGPTLTRPLSWVELWDFIGDGEVWQVRTLEQVR